MKESNLDDLIRARISSELKQEFVDIFPNISEKLIDLIDEAIFKEKEKYLRSIAVIIKQMGSLDPFERLVDEMYTNSIKLSTNPDFSRIDRDSIEPRLDQIIMPDGVNTDHCLGELYSLIWDQLVNGLYVGSVKHDNFKRVQKLFSNKSKVLDFINIILMRG